MIDVRTLPTTMIQVLTPFAPLFSSASGSMSSCCSQVRSLPHPRGRCLRLAGSGVGGRTAVLSLPSGLEPRRHVAHGEASCVLLGLLVEAFVPEGSLCWVSPRRSKGTAWEEDFRQGYLPRPTEIQPLALRQNERPQMGVPDAFGRGPLGLSGLGLAVPAFSGGLL
jgi:hypothetical protein